jgi:hypothetical protein
MTRMILPNVTISEHDANEPFQDLVGVEDYPILANSKQSVIWNAIRNGHISKARRAMSSDGVGDVSEKPIRDQILRKYPSDQTDMFHSLFRISLILTSPMRLHTIRSKDTFSPSNVVKHHPRAGGRWTFGKTYCFTNLIPFKASL